MTTTSTRRRLAVFTVLAIGLFLFAWLESQPAKADGFGSPEVCKTAHNMSGNQDHQSYTAPEGWVVSGVCIKAGLYHSGVLGNGTDHGGCYLVAGIGTRTATVDRIGNPSPSCQGISHVDVLKARGQETTTTTTPETTTTTEPETTTTTEPETTTTTVPEETTTTVPEETTTTVPETTTTTEPETTTTTPETTTTTEPTTTTAPPVTTTTTEPPSSVLPFTGPPVDPGLLIPIASALVLSGLGVLGLRRRYRLDE